MEEEQERKNIKDSSIVQFLRHRELGLQKPQKVDLKLFLINREKAVHDTLKCSGNMCELIDELGPNHNPVRCFESRLRAELDSVEKHEKL